MAVEDEFLGVTWETEDTALPPPDGCCTITRGGVEDEAWPSPSALAVRLSPSKNPTCGIRRLGSWPLFDVSISMGGWEWMELWPSRWPSLSTIIPSEC